ncbi:unnamed protein product, partial [Effrenium voratum]
SQPVATTRLFLKRHPEFAALGGEEGYVPCWHGKAKPKPGLPRPDTPAPDPVAPAPVPAIASPAPAPTPSSACKIFTLWEYEKAPLYARLNVETWRRHTQGLCDEPVLVNSKNVMKWIPDMPKEFFRFPYHAATSDLIRYGLLYHHGGIYMDADFIVLKDLSPVLSRLSDHDLISYATVSNPGGACSDSFSSNFIAGRKGSVFMKEMWQKQKFMITKHCSLSDKTKEIVCCFDDPKVECHIPFAGIGEGTSHPMLNSLIKQKVPMKTYCFADEDSFVPDHFAYVLEHVNDLKKANQYLEERNIKKGLDRMAFHMFNSIIPFKTFSCKKLFTQGSTVGHLYLTAFSTGKGAEPKKMSGDVKAFLAEHPDFAGFQANSEGGWPCKDAHEAAVSVAKFRAARGDAREPEPAEMASGETRPVDERGARERARPTKCKIYTYWEYEGLGPLYLRINVESWRRHAKQCSEPVLLTLANVRQHVPDLPEEFFRLPYPEARADFIRWGAIFNNGGIFLEPDVLMKEDITSIIEKIDANDLVSSQEEPGEQECSDQFNPAIIAGPKGSPYFKAVWEAHKSKLTNHCPLKDKEKEVICCFDEKENCHIPWLAMNRGIAHPTIRDWHQLSSEKMTSFCFHKGSAFQPAHLQEVVRNRWEMQRAQHFWKGHNVPRPMERMLYHFQQHGMHLQELDCSKLFDASTAIGTLYSAAFSGEAAQTMSSRDAATIKFYDEHPFMRSVNHVFQDGLPCKRFGPAALPTLSPGYRGRESCRIFTLWEYPDKGAPTFKMLNIESWRRHTHGLCQEPILINDKNVKEWIPDMPDEYFRMPAPAPKSDLIRYALLYHHGGLYMDADFVAVKDMDPIVALLETHDFISYQEKGEPGQVCSSAFSSNLLGGRKGSAVHKFIWDRQKEKMQGRCGKVISGNEACCYDSPKKRCNVPWAALGEGVSHPAFNDLMRTGDIFETFCFADEWTFVPDHFAYSVEHIPAKAEAVKYMEERGIKKALDRIVYHLFNAITPLKTWKCATLLDPRRLVGYLYSESFQSENGRRPVPKSPESDAWLEAHPEFGKYQEVYNGWQPCPGPVETTPEPPAPDSEECKIFTLWEYKTGPPLAVALNVEGWRRHSQGRCGEPVLINDENVQTYLPDMPEEYFRMPYSQAKSDIIRYGLLFHHGGIYMDTDFLVVKDLGEVLDLAQKYDLVSYTDESTGALEKGACSKHFSSNFMAARKGSVFMKAVWDRQKQLMQAHCPLSEKELEKVCCFDNAKVQCHIPWAGIGEGVSHPVFDELEGEGTPFSSYCFSDERGFTPPDMINILGKTKLAEAEEIWGKMEKPAARDPLGRIMYHTFNSIMPWSGFSCKQIFDTSSVYGKLNYLSFTTGSGSKSLPATPEYMEWLQKNKMKRQFTKNHNGLPCET